MAPDSLYSTSMSRKAVAVILVALAIVALGIAVYRAIPLRDQVSIENVWKAPIP